MFEGFSIPSGTENDPPFAVDPQVAWAVSKKFHRRISRCLFVDLSDQMRAIRVSKLHLDFKKRVYGEERCVNVVIRHEKPFDNGVAAITIITDDPDGLIALIDDPEGKARSIMHANLTQK
ncbi:hypothetical protein KW800_02140 [Candidatus Parcubacteria bacterium]|nr:hypothetical protein [Candidatus Parcubacteria bacterium]